MVYALTIDSTTFPAAKFSNIGTVLNIVLPLTMAGAAMIFLAMTLMAAFNIITHGDNPDALKKAYSSLIFSVVGILIVMSSYLVVRVIGGIIGAQLLP
ncbi:MAG: hypothetical protein UR68_C0028G0058 [Candidatus Roizmanbacteria bacterium GW2011_GWA2_35_19]|uniref:Uncharacterized protein n=2 Tax=Candidatus Roizmaniibacteriota TaxID=1752723 RepID=A0A0G0C6I0_9BACT|nr:MAG: hypothetical protein UR63_C0050G0007 [Candidatus Roizmanbacteria bacterium GW2011_GWC2_35_12]KKP71741.1 MAG: hypothetical protein UR68_C0028G0058 [Candidatus Roizmanbacteria bacterium GW2011_GWA2_35_19]